MVTNGAAADVSNREREREVVILCCTRMPGGEQDGAGAEDRMPPSKQRSVTAVVTSKVPKPFICPCSCLISHMCPALAKSICCATHPYRPCQTRGTSGGSNAKMQFYLLPNAHRLSYICPCDPERNNDGTPVSYRCSVNQNRAKQIAYNAA